MVVMVGAGGVCAGGVGDLGDLGGVQETIS